MHRPNRVFESRVLCRWIYKMSSCQLFDPSQSLKKWSIYYFDFKIGYFNMFMNWVCYLSSIFEHKSCTNQNLIYLFTIDIISFLRFTLDLSPLTTIHPHLLAIDRYFFLTAFNSWKSLSN